MRGNDRGRFRAGADDRHLALDDVQHLGKLIKLEVTDDLAGGEDAVVMGCRDLRSATVDMHRPELVHTKRLFILADTVGHVKERSRRGQLDRQCRGQQQRCGQHQHREREESVEKTNHHDRISVSAATT